MMRFVTIVACAAAFAASSTGCAHNAVNTADDQQGRAFVSAMKAVPFDQREAFVEAHPEGVNAVAKSRDRKLNVDYFTALRYSH